MLRYFGILTVLSFGSLLLALILTVVSTNESVKNSSRRELELQIENQAEATLKEAGQYFIQFLSRYDKSVASMISESTRNMMRPDYSMSLAEPSYFEYGDTYLYKPLTQDSRQIKPVSMEHSAYYVTGSTPSDIASFSAEIKDTRNRTAHLDQYFRHVYRTSEDLVAAYTGFDTSPDSLFRQYPGSGSLTSDPSRTYDATQRPWYTAATASPGKTAVTAPYGDAFGKGWMITVSRVIYDYTVSTTVLGVSGADILIESLNEVLSEINFLESGKLTLFESSGQVVSDQEWSMDSSDLTPFMYSDLTSPAVSTSTWNSIVATPAGEESTVKFGGYVAFVSHLADYSGQYYLVVFVKEEEILAPIASTLDNLDSANAEISGMLVGISVSVFVVLMFVVLMIVNGILKTFADMERNVDTLLSNVGCTERNLADGMMDISSVQTIELQRMNNNMNAIINNLRNSRESSQPATMSNAAYDQASFFQNMVPFYTVSVTEAVPSIPIVPASMVAAYPENVHGVLPSQPTGGGH